MSIVENMRVRLINKIVDIALEYGVMGYVKRTTSVYGDVVYEVWCDTPDSARDTTPEECYKKARKSADTLAEVGYWKVRRVYRFTKKRLRGVKVRQDQYNRIEKQVTDTARVEAMLDLYKSGNEDHPLYVVLAEAKTFAEIKSITKLKR